MTTVTQVPLASTGHRITRGDVLEAWTRSIGTAPASDDDKWNDCNGDSLKQIQLLIELESRLGGTLPLDVLSEDMTPRSLLARIEAALESGAFSPADSRASDGKPKVFFAQAIGLIRGPDMHTEALSRAISGDATLTLLRYDAVDLIDGRNDTFETIVSNFTKAITASASSSPFFLVGHCYGGAVLIEVASRLQNAPNPPALLVLLDSEFARSEAFSLAGLASTLKNVARGKTAARALASYTAGWVFEKLAGLRTPSVLHRLNHAGLIPQSWANHVALANMRTSRERHRFSTYRGRAVVAWGSHRRVGAAGYRDALGWAKHLNELETREVVCSGHMDIVSSPEIIDMLTSQARRLRLEL